VRNISLGFRAPKLRAFLLSLAKTNNMLHKLVIIASLLIYNCCATAQAIKTPQPSPGQTIKQDFGISSIELTYSRPGIKGRKIFGDLVPYGKVWRTGANSATRIKFTDDVTIGGQPLKAGEYAIFSIPGETEWEMIINKGSANWGTDYDASLDLVHFKAKSVKMEAPVETFTMQFANVKPTSAELHIMWDRTAVAIPITTEIDSKVMAQIGAAMGRDSRPYFQAAMYYLDTNKDLAQAIIWFDKALEQTPDAYWVYHQKANALAKQGKKAEARTAAQRSMDLARTQKNEDYVKLNEKLLISLQ
jgi:tetratricopeptide (TPR) repeat protein